MGLYFRRDSGYVAFQDQNLKVGVWHYFNQLLHENWHTELLIKFQILDPNDVKTGRILQYVNVL